MSPENEIDDGILGDTAEYVDVTVGLLEIQDAKGRFLIQKDYRVSGDGGTLRQEKQGTWLLPGKEEISSAHCDDPTQVSDDFFAAQILELERV
jgi:hypothetical protein